jgi:hypothetical protein
MENSILNRKASNSYLKKFEIAKFNLSLLSGDKNANAGFRNARLLPDVGMKRNNSQS